MAYGITTEGFNRKRLDTLLEELQAEMKAIFRENFNTDSETPEGQINGVVSESNANLWELAELAYNQFNPSAIGGVLLSNLVQLNGITRLEAKKTTVILSCGGVNGTIIPIGSIASTNDSLIKFYTLAEGTIDGTGFVSIEAEAEDEGDIIALNGTVTVINTPITGWDTVTNPSDAILGRFEETDTELRARRIKSVSIPAQAMIDSIFAELSNVDGVSQVSVIENDENVTDANGQPAHSFQAVVTGGSDSDIGESIWKKKPAGIQSFGNQSVNILDSQGFSHAIGFSRPTTIPIFVIVTISRDADYPGDGDEAIKQAIVDYANGDLVANEGFFLGDDVIQSRLFTPVNSIPNHDIVSITIGTSPNPLSSANISISATEVSFFDFTNITVL